MWKCEKCNKTSERLQIAWGICAGEKVDILDYWCNECGNAGYKDEAKLTFIGTEEDRIKYWNDEWSGYKDENK